MFLDTVVQTVCFVSLIVLPHSKRNLHNRLRKQASDTLCPWVKRNIYLTVQSDTGAWRSSMYNAGCATKEPADSSDINWNGQQTIRVYYSRSLQWNIQILTCDDQRPRDNKISKLIAEYPCTAWLCYRVLHTLDVVADNCLTGHFRLARPHWNNMARLSCHAKYPNPLQMYGWVICFEINCTWKQMSHRVMFAYRCWSEI